MAFLSFTFDQFVIMFLLFSLYFCILISKHFCVWAFKPIHLWPQIIKSSIYKALSDWFQFLFENTVIIMQLPPRENRDDLYATLNWFIED